jgi:signal transduction histidine kinase
VPRHVLLFFKEVVTNVARHARASIVGVKIELAATAREKCAEI